MVYIFYLHAYIYEREVVMYFRVGSRYISRYHIYHMMVYIYTIYHILYYIHVCTEVIILHMICIYIYIEVTEFYRNYYNINNRDYMWYDSNLGCSTPSIVCLHNYTKLYIKEEGNNIDLVNIFSLSTLCTSL